MRLQPLVNCSAKPFSYKVFTIAVWKKAVPWWSLPLNWIVGESKYSVLQAVLLTVLNFSDFWKPCGQSFLCGNSGQM
jgi:hypothetical protein